MDPKSTLMMIVWLAVLGAVIVYGARAVSQIQAKTGL